MWPVDRRTLFALSILSLISAIYLLTAQTRVFSSKLLVRNKEKINTTTNRELYNVKSSDASTSTTEITSTTSAPTSTQRSHCEAGPKKNLMFLKTHKTGSSTVQNVLVRKAWKDNTFIGLPVSAIYFKYATGRKFLRSFMKKTPLGKTVNMLVHHMVFNYKEVYSILPNDTVYFTVLRDPATQFESVFHYMRPHVRAFARVGRSFGVTGFAKEPYRYFRGRMDGNFWWFSKNNMLYDLGFNNLNDSQEFVDETTEKMDKMFHLVLIAEHFDISLLLLKDLLCWDIKDMVYLSMNARNQSTVEHVTDDVKERIRKWNKADTELYRYYNKTFWEKVRDYGEKRLQRDLIELERLKKATSELCVEKELISNKDVKDKTLKMFNPPGIDVTQYKPKPQAYNNDTCIGLILPEGKWLERFDKRQYPRPVKPVKKLPGKPGVAVIRKSPVVFRKPVGQKKAT